MESMKYRYLRVLRNRPVMFWTLLYPIILATFMYFAFGSIGEDFEAVPAAVVEKSENSGFDMMLDEVTDLVTVTYMDENEAKEALAEGGVKGIFYASDTPTLTVNGEGADETILSMLLDAYYKNGALFEDIYEANPESIGKVSEMLSGGSGADTEFIREVTLGGRTYDTTLEYFFSCIAMACLFGSFTGSDLAGEFAANIATLGARRSVSPEHKLKALVTDLIVALSVQSVNAMILLLYMQYVLKISFSGNLLLTFIICVAGSLVGIAFGMVVGAATKLPQALQTVLIVVVPLISCFLSGLMYFGMKHVIEKRVPVINRLNPSALMSDALYHLNVYDDPGTMWMRLAMLLAIGAALTFFSFAMLWRTRYESI